MLGLIIGLVAFIPLATWLLGYYGLPRWIVTVLLLSCGLALHLIALRLQMHYVRRRAPELLDRPGYVASEAIDHIPKWTTQFTGGTIAAGLAVAYTWLVRFL